MGKPQALTPYQLLSNANYVERAPADIVEKERQRINDMRSALEKLEEQRKIVS